jgi:hypothetical protein
MRGRIFSCGKQYRGADAWDSARIIALTKPEGKPPSRGVGVKGKLKIMTGRVTVIKRNRGGSWILAAGTMAIGGGSGIPPTVGVTIKQGTWEDW